MNYKDLTDREIDALVARVVMQWPDKLSESDIDHLAQRCNLGALPGGYLVDGPCKRRGTTYSAWMPSRDLNESFEAQAKCIEKVGWKAIEKQMWVVHGYPASVDDLMQFCATATARQRCEAMLNALRGEEE